ncbi:MAG: hypothetical protein O3A00_03560 [Planctomycetota bacterium]|nr:hypothetical protein [Planctomycetota bacterium]
MEALEALLYSFVDVFAALWELVIAILRVLVPWTPLAAWIGFWMCCVNWRELRPLLARGGWIGLFLLGFVMILVWGNVAPPEDGIHHIFGLQLSNFVGKTVYVTTLICIMLLCGSVQLSGLCNQFCKSEEPEEPETHDVAAAH